MTIEIVVTPGESAIRDAFREADVKVVEDEDLPVSDILFRDETGKILKLFERKAKGDLLASIKDGRYKDQKTRLIASGANRRDIVYIIEQLKMPKRGTQDHKIVWSSMCNMEHRDGFTVVRTANPNETIDYLLGMVKSMEKFTAIEDSVTAKDIDVNIKTKKVDPPDWFKYSLTTINKCSIGIATVIAGEYPSITDFLERVETPKDIANLKHGKSQRRIGDKLATHICECVKGSSK